MAGLARFSQGLSEKWNRSRQLADRALRDRDETHSEEIFALEIDVLRGPIASLSDAIAKLRAVGLSLVEGERTDGADQDALDQTIRWLEARATLRANGA